MKKGIVIGSFVIVLIIAGFYNYTLSKMSVSDIIEKAVVNYLDQGIEADFLRKKSLINLVISKTNLNKNTLHIIGLRPFSQIMNQKFIS